MLVLAPEKRFTVALIWPKGDLATQFKSHCVVEVDVAAISAARVHIDDNVVDVEVVVVVFPCGRVIANVSIGPKIFVVGVVLVVARADNLGDGEHGEHNSNRHGHSSFAHFLRPHRI